MWQAVAAVYLCIAFYFTTSISLTIFNKWFFSEKPASSLSSLNSSATTSGISHGDRYSSQQFHFPLTVTCVHQGIVFLLVLASEHNFLQTFVGPIERSRSTLVLIAPVGIASGLDWGLSNTSLRWIPLTMYEMVKCSAPIIVLVLGWWIGVQSLTPRIATVIGLLSLGVFLSVTGGHISAFTSADFPFQGFMCVVVATLLAGIRVVFAQRILHGDKSSPGVNTATFLFYVTPSSAAALLIPAYIFEGPEIARYISSHSAVDCCWVGFLIFASSCLAYFLSLSEYLLTQKTSALTLSVCGIAKQVLITAIAMAVFHEKLGGANIVGVFLCFVGIAAYNVMKYHQSTQYVTIPRDEELSTQRTESVDDDDATFTRRSEKYSY
jgi:solute carrier family 35, member C2